MSWRQEISSQRKYLSRWWSFPLSRREWIKGVSQSCFRRQMKCMFMMYFSLSRLQMTILFLLSWWKRCLVSSLCRVLYSSSSCRQWLHLLRRRLRWHQHRSPSCAWTCFTVTKSSWSLPLSMSSDNEEATSICLFLFFERIQLLMKNVCWVTEKKREVRDGRHDTQDPPLKESTLCSGNEDR